MNFQEFSKLTEEIFEKNSYGELLNQERIQKLYELTVRMLEVNKSMNLTAIKDEGGIILRHYADSLAVSEYIPEGSTVIDVGCGAGFPALPLAIFRPDLKITALDSTAKRINYVAETAAMLGLDNVTAVAARAEDYGNDAKYREKFDIVTARAVAALPVLTELCLPLAKISGSFVAMKASKAQEELELSRTAITKCGGELMSITDKPLVALDGTSESRFLIKVSKIKATPKEFPRHYSKISKKPL